MNSKIQAINADGHAVEFNGTEWTKDTTEQEQTTDSQNTFTFTLPKKDKPKDLRTRRFCLTSYIDSKALERYVSTSPWVQHWAMATHDKDLNEDGTSKVLHTHLLLYTYEAKTASSIKKKFDNFSRQFYDGTDTEPQNTLVQICRDMGAQWRYLIHKDDKDKYQYESIIRLCDNFSYWHKLDDTNGMTDSSNNTALAIVQDILGGESTMSMLERYGRDFAIHHSHYMNIARRHVSETMSQKNKPCWDLLPLLLETSHFSKSQQLLFKEMLDFVRTECLMQYGTEPNFVLENTDKYERKVKLK